MVEIEEGTTFCSIYVPRTKENKHLIRRLSDFRAPTADYWESWNAHTKAYFTTDLSHYEKTNCIGHSWTFNTPLLVNRLKRMVGTLPFTYEKTH